MPIEIVLQNFIDGKFVEAQEFLDSFDPSTGDVWAQIPDSGKLEVDKAVSAAKSAFPKWSATTVAERSKIIMKTADILESRLEEFAQFESRDQGKPVSLARAVDIPRAVYNFRFFATAILHHLDTSSVLDAVGAVNYTIRQPIGVAGLISPWNLPMYLLTFKIAPAIACGNTVVCKPSEMTSVTAWMLCSIFNEAGLPAGVVNVVFGTGPKVGEALVSHPDVPVISFTGSTATAERIRQASSKLSKKLSLELGGKNPAVVFDDVDLDKCLPSISRSTFANQGEICLCSSRIFVQKGIYDTFLQKFIETAKGIKVGDPKDASTNMGALVSHDHLKKVKGFVTTAREINATIHCGEGVDQLELPENKLKGYYMRPTVVTDVSDDSRLMQEEIFGPVVCIVPFSNEEEVTERANNVKYGLSATVWSQDVGKVHRVAHKLHAGTVWCNCWMLRDLNMPFGGTKASGIGREGAADSIDFYTEVKTVCIKM